MRVIKTCSAYCVPLLAKPAMMSAAPYLRGISFAFLPRSLELQRYFWPSSRASSSLITASLIQSSVQEGNVLGHPHTPSPVFSTRVAKP